MAKFNLNYKFDANLKELPEDSTSMAAYVQFCQEAIKVAEVDSEKNFRLLVKFLGDIGAYAKILGKQEMAIRALERSLELIERNKMGSQVWAIHSLRYGDVLRFKKDFLAAETAFRSVLALSERQSEVQEYADFAWQHLGKLKFDEGQFPEAIQCLNKALELRKQKGIKELIESTNFALRVIQMKMSVRKT